MSLTELALRKIDIYDRKTNTNRHNINHWVKYWISYGDSQPSRKILSHFVDTDRLDLREVTYFYDRIYHPTTHGVKTHRLRKQER